MPDLLDEIKTLALRLNQCDDTVAEFAAQYARAYRHQTQIIDGLIGVDRMVSEPLTAEQAAQLERRHGQQIRAAREALRDKLRDLLGWAEANGRRTGGA